MAVSRFTFIGHEADISQGTFQFHYELVHAEQSFRFTESLSFDPGRITQSVNESVVKNILDGLLILLGVSYWKTYCPKELVLPTVKLTKDQAVFWNTVYTKGLGEFFYRNQIDFRGLVFFPYSDQVGEQATSNPRMDRSLVPMGGGKDSIVCAEALAAGGKEFDLIALGAHGIQRNVARVMGKELLEVKRVMDPQLFELNKQPGVANGHIPISAVYAFVHLLSAALYDYRYIVLANEESANYGNVSYLGAEINHQWSKSFEFETLLQAYVQTYITPDIHYFSLLRPYKEIKIVELFSRYQQYFPVFSSCNRYFTQGVDAAAKWCGECPKCAFVFLLMAAFVPKETVVWIFGKNLFAETALLPLFRELVGLEGIKPFECVGIPDETRYALWRVGETHAYDADPVFAALKESLKSEWDAIGKIGASLLQRTPTHAIPKAFEHTL